jgi:transcriptional regulator with XRE-family HTH domain
MRVKEGSSTMDDKQAQELGIYLRGRREQAGLSVRALADLVATDNSQIVRLEAGRVSHPKADLLGRICVAVRAPVTDVMTMAGYPTPKGLPGLRPYMRAKYRDLPPEALDELEALVAKLSDRHHSGPVAGEDER